MSYGIFLYFIHSVFQKTSSCFEREIFKVHYNCRGFSGFSFFILPMNILDIPDAISPVSITSYSFTHYGICDEPSINIIEKGCRISIV